MARVTTSTKHLQEEPARIILDTDREVQAMQDIVIIMREQIDNDEYVIALLTDIEEGLQS